MQQWKFFRIPVNGPDDAEESFNRFLRSHRVLAVHREFVAQGECSYWALAVEHLADVVNTVPRKENIRREKPDYRQILSPDDFARFATLREWRKQSAQAVAVPVYTILTNEQMAEIARNNCRTKADLERIDGVGQGRIEKYGSEILALLLEKSDETGREPVPHDSRT